MNEYINLDKNTIIDLSKDICPYDIWISSHNSDYLCTKHPNGFLVFLDPASIDKRDEYKNGDPFGLSDSFTSEFQKRRINTTIELIKGAELYDNTRILDIGCGEGRFTNMIKETFNDYEVYGLDHSMTALKNASNKFKNINFVLADGLKPPFVSSYFDIIVCNNIWEHIIDPCGLLISISRILKSGGILIISTPSRFSFINLVNVIRGRKVTLMSKHHITEYTVGQMVEILTFAGYDLIKITSPEIVEGGFLYTKLKKLTGLFIKLIGSHHILESTVFYQAKLNRK